MIITLKWFNEKGEQVGNFDEFVDYIQWNQLVSRSQHNKLGS